jgi:hypothetical protein
LDVVLCNVCLLHWGKSIPPTPHLRMLIPWISRSGTEEGQVFFAQC